MISKEEIVSPKGKFIICFFICTSQAVIRNAKELYEFAEINMKDPAPSRYQSENVKVKRRTMMIFCATVEIGILKKLKETDPFMRLQFKFEAPILLL